MPHTGPYPETDTWSLNYAAQTLRSGGEDLAGGAEDLRSTWRGLQSHYTAPESEVLFAAMNPVVTRAEDVESDLVTVAEALEGLAEAATTARRELNTLRMQAQSFYNRHHDKAVWWLTKDEETDEWAIGENIRLKDGVNTAWEAFNEAEIECHNTISSITGGPTYAAPDRASGDDLVYGLPTDAGERDLSYSDVFSVETFNGFANDVTGWAGSEFHPSMARFGNSTDQAAWDIFVVDGLWGAAVGLQSTLGFWHPDRGWRFDPRGRWENAKDSLHDSLIGGATLIGVHDDQGWLFDPDKKDELFWGATWGRWGHNIEASGVEWLEGNTAWSRREEDSEYTAATSAINAGMLTAGLPLKLLKGALTLGPGGSVDTPSSPDGSFSSSDFTSGGRAGTGNWPSSPLPDPGQGRPRTSERFGDFLEELDSPLIGPPDRGPDTPSPTPTPRPEADPTPTPSPTPNPSPQPDTDPSPSRPRDDEGAPNQPRGDEDSPNTDGNNGDTTSTPLLRPPPHARTTTPTATETTTTRTATKTTTVPRTATTRVMAPRVTPPRRLRLPPRNRPTTPLNPPPRAAPGTAATEAATTVSPAAAEATVMTGTTPTTIATTATALPQLRMTRSPPNPACPGSGLRLIRLPNLERMG